jgi:hypothetical protein
MDALSTVQVTPPEVPVEQDFYSRFNAYRRLESLEFTHPNSRVKFVYPSDDAIAELNYIVLNNFKGCKPKTGSGSLLLYLMVFHFDNAERQARSLIVTEDFLAIVTEDHVSYPLPTFTKSSHSLKSMMCAI